ncbi:phosphodiesterase [Sphingomonas populi]|uniref:Phosphodiesterase n=1 Tax=Sphingomonas populi TaxID=2484750 RepID=A0A4Q6XVY3_9SPHN|nr:phosphodiesterase [Sphingomonas populi]RZF61099.1 phosphodiesterase [Sphingomonas populi]
MLIAQITDTHVVARDSRAYRDQVDTNGMMTKAVDRLNRLDPRPDCVVITGDLCDHGTVTEYDELKRQLARLHLPFYLVIGNHDDRKTMLASLDYPHLADAWPFVQYTVEDMPVRIIALDSTSDDHHMGEFCEARRAWLEERLAEQPDRPTIVALHHPPFDCGITLMDAEGTGWAQGLIETLSRYPNIERVLCGHVHRSIQAVVGGRLATICPSTAHQVNLDLAADPSAQAFFEMEPPAFQLHRWKNGQMVTHTALVDRYREVFPISAEMLERMRSSTVRSRMMKKDLVF